MPEVPGNPPSPRTPLFWTGVAWLRALVDAAGRLQVRGEDQLFSYLGVLAETRELFISGAGGYVESPGVPAGEIWVVTTVSACDATTGVSSIWIANRHDGVNVDIQVETRAFAIWDRSNWAGHTCLDYDDTIRAYFTGGLAGDTCRICITGHRMTLEV